MSAPPGEWLFADNFDAGVVTFDRAVELSGFSPAELIEMTVNDPVVIRLVEVDGRHMLDLGDLLLVRLITTATPAQYCPPPDGVTE